MEASLLNQWFSGHQINAICWTLIHSLWIGLLIALMCGIIVATTRKSTAALRYRLLCSLLVLFICAIGVTYYLEANSASVSPASEHIPNIMVKARANYVVNPVTIAQNETFLDNVKGFLNQNLNIIFLVWLLFFVLKSLKMISGLLYIQRIRHYKTSDVTEELKHRIEYLSGQIGIRRVVRLVQSGLVKVPVAVGWLKPMILLPVGIVFQLTPEQLDGILWHELAHIRRRDYLVNILQGLVETVFFFNPGLLWLSSLIRTEREACCDDMVLSRMNRKANYLEALLSFGYGEFSQARYAMSIGSGNQLRDRLKRMISQENKRLSIAEKSVLAIGLVLLTAFTTVSKDNTIVKHLTIKFSNKSGKVVTKTITGTMKISMHRLPDGQRVNDSKPGQRKKDTIVVTDTAIRFTSVLFKRTDADLANNDISAMDDKGNKYHFIVANDKLVAAEVNGVKVADDKLANFQYMITYIDREVAEKRLVRSADIARYKAKNPVAKFKSKDSVGYNKKKYVPNKQSADVVPAKFDDDQRYTDRQASDARARDMKTEAKLNRLNEDSINYAVQQKRADDLIADLVQEKVVPNANAVTWFGLSETELIVNGQKQSDELHEKLMKKYGVYKYNGLFYGPVQMHGTGIFIDGKGQAPRPPHPERPGPKYMGNVMPNSRDSIVWKQQQLIMQQKRFAAEQDENRQQIIRQQKALMAEQNEKRAQIQQQQQNFRADYFKKMNQQRQTLLTQLQPAISGVITDLVSANVIGDKSQLSSFILTNQSLMVNGKKQAEDIHEKLKSKYLDRSAYTGSSDGMDWNRFKNDPNFGLQFDTNGNEGIGIIGQ